MRGTSDLGVEEDRGTQETAEGNEVKFHLPHGRKGDEKEEKLLYFYLPLPLALLLQCHLLLPRRYSRFRQRDRIAPYALPAIPHSHSVKRCLGFRRSPLPVCMPLPRSWKRVALPYRTETPPGLHKRARNPASPCVVRFNTDRSKQSGCDVTGAAPIWTHHTASTLPSLLSPFLNASSAWPATPHRRAVQTPVVPVVPTALESVLANSLSQDLLWHPLLFTTRTHWLHALANIYWVNVCARFVRVVASVSCNHHRCPTRRCHSKSRKCSCRCSRNKCNRHNRRRYNSRCVRSHHRCCKRSHPHCRRPSKHRRHRSLGRRSPYRRHRHSHPPPLMSSPFRSTPLLRNRYSPQQQPLLLPRRPLIRPPQ